MPLIKSAKKKLRKDRKKTQSNRKHEIAYKKLTKTAKKGKNNASNVISKVYSALDRAVKRNIIHKNKAARLKSLIQALVRKQ